MSLISAVRTGASTDVLTSLRAVCDSQGLGDLSAHLADLADLVQWDMKDLEKALSTLPYGENIVHRSAEHLLTQSGKRLRPMCVALASRIGDGFSPAVQAMGVAVELVHCATLLHDDVIDLGNQRRGAPSARMLYGNAASVFAGDWLLIESLRRVRNANVPGVLERLFDIIDEMISAEAIQLENRGRVDTKEESYFDVVEGKTAALFRWGMYAGGRAGGLDEAECEGLEGYGMHLGVAFQLVDDLLDYVGDSSVTGKALFADLREGKMTYPLLVARDRDPRLRPLLEQAVSNSTDDVLAGLHSDLMKILEETGALDQTRALAQERAAQAAKSLECFPESRARAALLTVAKATVHRDV